MFQVDNPYALANATSIEDVRVDRTFIFGDSYSATIHNGIRNWINFVTADRRTDVFTNFAVRGAQANDTVTKSFQAQIDAFRAQDKRPNGRDLTVTYFGYNDLSRRENLRASFDDYRDGIGQLIDAGATSSRQRLFVTMLHDWGRNPRNEDDLRQFVIQWNGWIADFANNRDRVVAVDLFTPFERIYNNPARYGFTNVTSADPDNADRTALYTDGAHFGERGQQIIAQIFEYYLTRGWDFSNTLAAGSAATARLNEDLDRDRVFSLADKDSEPLQFFALGNGDAAIAEARAVGMQTDFRSHFAQESSDGGIGMQYSLADGLDVGVALGQYSHDNTAGRDLSSQRTQVEQKSVSLFGDTDLGDAGALGAWRGHTRMTFGENDLLSSSSDELIGRRNSAHTSGQSFSVSERLTGAIRSQSPMGGLWFTPSFDLTYSQQKIDGYRIANDYVGDTVYGGSKAGELWGAMSLAARLDPLDLGHERFLGLSADISWARSLMRDDHVVDISETGTFARTTRETIEKNAENIVRMGLAGTMNLNEKFDITAGYGLTARTGEDNNHSLRIGLDWKF